MPDRPCIRCRILHGIDETCAQAKARAGKRPARKASAGNGAKKSPPKKRGRPA